VQRGPHSDPPSPFLIFVFFVLFPFLSVGFLLIFSVFVFHFLTYMPERACVAAEEVVCRKRSFFGIVLKAPRDTSQNVAHKAKLWGPASPHPTPRPRGDTRTWPRGLEQTQHPQSTRTVPNPPPEIFFCLFANAAPIPTGRAVAAFVFLVWGAFSKNPENGIL